MTGSVTHNEAIARARLAASAAGLRVFKRDVGLFFDRRGNQRRIGTNGEADLQGWQVGTGRAVGIEIKTGKAVRTKEQEKWGAAFEADGGLYIVARYAPGIDGDETIRAAAQS